VSEVADLLVAAGDVLLRTSWDPTCEARDASGAHVGAVWPAKSYSLVGAIMHAAEGDSRLVCQVVVNVLGSNGLTRPTPLNTWENEPDRTVEDVLALLERATTRLREIEAIPQQPSASSPPQLALL
jgi:hypothetical protein